MGIGTSRGEYFEDEFAQYSSGAPITPDLGASGRPSTATEKPAGELFIDREHHVPLAASALMHADGSMYGIAIDHRIPPNPDYDKFVGLHEAAELPHMQNLIKAGQNPTEAYHEAHDKIATPIETAAVRAHAAGLGRDPDQYLDDYKQFWRDGASIASQPSDKERHLDAHTTRYGLDEAEKVYG